MGATSSAERTRQGLGCHSGFAGDAVNIWRWTLRRAGPWAVQGRLGAGVERGFQASCNGLGHASLSQPRRGLGGALRTHHVRSRTSTVAVTFGVGDLWRDVWREIAACDGLGEHFSMRKVKAHTTIQAVHTGLVTADDRAG